METTSLLLCALATLLVLLAWARQGSSRMPPGPPAIPFFGTLALIARQSPVITFLSEEIARKYGDVVRFRAGTLNLFVLNDFRMAKDLFHRDEANGRYQFYFHRYVKGHAGKPLGIASTSGQQWQDQRRFALKTLRDFGFGRRGLDPVMQEEAVAVTKALGQGLVRIETTFTVPIVNVLWRMVASKRFDENAPETQEMVNLLNAGFREGFAAQEFFQILRPYLPYTTIDLSVIKIKQELRTMIEDHLRDFDPNDHRDFIDMYLAEIRKGEDSEFNLEQLASVCVDFFQAGAETTSTTLMWLVMYMALNPDVQRNCQEEIDAYLGSRLPVQDDAANMTYVSATIMEVQRLARTAPSTLPHSNTVEVTLGEYVIPKGSVILPNLQRFMHDPEVFPEPMQLRPERFLEDGKMKKVDQWVPFGLGKRICMGETLARGELFIFFVVMLQQLTFTLPPKDKVAQELFPDPQRYTMGITTIPLPFMVDVSKR